MDAGWILILGSFAVTFIVARVLGKRYRARRDAERAQRELARQSRQVRRAAARKNKG